MTHSFLLQVQDLIHPSLYPYIRHLSYVRQASGSEDDEDEEDSKEEEQKKVAKGGRSEDSCSLNGDNQKTEAGEKNDKERKTMLMTQSEN